MKTFTVSQADELIPIIRPKLEAISATLAGIRSQKDAAVRAAMCATAGGGMPGGTDYVRAIYEFGRMTTEIIEMGVEIKDPSIGLIDFPCVRNGEVVYLCWKLGEPEFIEWWHRIDDGFGGRQPI